MASRYTMPMQITGGSPSMRDTRKTLVDSETIVEMSDSQKDEGSTPLTDDRWLITVKDGQFPPPQMEWLKDFERNPDEPLKKSYRSGILLQHVDPSAPVVRIAITFLAGADKPTVAKAEMRKISDHRPFQKSHEWRMFTAATLLRRFEIGEDLTIQQKDDSQNIVNSIKERKNNRRSYTPSIHSEHSRNVLTKPGPEVETSQSIVKRNIQDHVLTIDSDCVELMHGLCPPDNNFDITCTLIEIDMFSMRDLMTNYRTIVQNGGRNIAATEVIQILDAMINDVRRLSTRSPRLFRMSTRSLIAQSTNTRYGVDYGSQFVTITTSEGIRKLIDQSSSYYLSLNDSKIDQNYIKPKFMQMLILLLALLNNDDLKKTTKVLESTFQIPGDRESIELLIMKVLPLGAINPEVFLEALFEAYKPKEKKEGGYELRLQRKIWEELQQDLAHKGYLVPTIIGNNGSANQSVWTTGHADDLEAELEDSDDENHLEDQESSSRYPYDDPRQSRQSPQYHAYDGAQYNSSGHSSQYNIPSQSSQFSQQKLPEQVSWQAPWPIDGVTSSSVFKYLQHDGYMRELGNSSGLVRAINDISFLEITSDDRDDTLMAKFTNNSQYRVSASDIEFISSMQKGTYILKTIDTKALINLEIRDILLNEPFMEATTTINILVSSIRSQFGGNVVRRRSILGKTSSFKAFTALDNVTEAKRVSADIVSPNGQRERIAEAYKIGNRVVYAQDVLREMNSSLTKISASAERLQKELARHSDIRGNDERARVQQRELQKLHDYLVEVTANIEQAKNRRTELQEAHRNLPEDPITLVIYPSFTYTAGEKPEWQPYQTQLAKDGKRLIVKSKKLNITNVIANPGSVIKVAFAECGTILEVEPLTSSGNDVPYSLRAGHTALWLGYYIVVVESSSKVKKGQTVQAYFKVRSQSLESGPQGRSIGIRDLPTTMSVLV